MRVSVVEQVEYAEISKQHSAKSELSCSGLGLQKAYIGRKNAFTVDCSNAGKSVMSSFIVIAKCIKACCFQEKASIVVCYSSLL